MDTPAKTFAEQVHDLYEREHVATLPFEPRGPALTEAGRGA